MPGTRPTRCTRFPYKREDDRLLIAGRIRVGAAFPDGCSRGGATPSRTGSGEEVSVPWLRRYAVLTPSVGGSSRGRPIPRPLGHPGAPSRQAHLERLLEHLGGPLDELIVIDAVASALVEGRWVKEWMID